MMDRDTIPEKRLVQVTMLVHSKDSELWNELTLHLCTLERQRQYQQVLWNTYELRGWSAYHATDLWGTRFYLENGVKSLIADLGQADIIVIGLSVDLLDLLQGIEGIYPTLMQKSLDGSTSLLLVGLRASVVRDEWLKKLPVFPGSGEPVSPCQHRDGMYVEVAEAIERAIDQRRSAAAPVFGGK
jgi:hypothetical protein